MNFKRVNRSNLSKSSLALVTTLAAGFLGNVTTQASSHVVQAGESFFAVAAQYGVNPYDLASQNGKTIYDTINPGDVLQVAATAAPAAPEAAAATSSHTVQPGESFFTIATSYGMDAFTLAANNGKGIYDTINPGDTLQVTAPAPVATPAPAVDATAATSSTEGVVLQTPTAHGNSFPVGQCTWGVKELAPWVNNWWGNAKDWAANAVAYNGYTVGNTPVAGAIAVWDGGDFGHVAYVTEVQSETSIQVLESNYQGNQQIGNYRGWFNPTTAQGNVTYIYPW